MDNKKFRALCLIAEAQISKCKGSWIEYESFIKKLAELGLDPQEYQRTVKAIAEALEV